MTGQAEFRFIDNVPDSCHDDYNDEQNARHRAPEDRFAEVTLVKYLFENVADSRHQSPSRALVVAVLTERFTMAYITPLLACLCSFTMRRPEGYAVVAGRTLQMALRTVSRRPGVTLGAFLALRLG